MSGDQRPRCAPLRSAMLDVNASPSIVAKELSLDFGVGSRSRLEKLKCLNVQDSDRLQVTAWERFNFI